jgi:hypothetical protein
MHHFRQLVRARTVTGCSPFSVVGHDELALRIRACGWTRRCRSPRRSRRWRSRVHRCSPEHSKLHHSGDSGSRFLYVCPNCSVVTLEELNFCPACGRTVTNDRPLLSKLQTRDSRRFALPLSGGLRPVARREAARLDGPYLPAERG